MSSDWPSEKTDSTRKAREAAEALFRPKPAGATVAPVGAGAGIAQAPSQPPAAPPSAVPQPVPRQPRILAAPPPPRRPDPEQQPPAVEARTPRARQRKIPAEEHRRIVTLVTYGMTSAEVAALYDVTVEVIDKIVAAEGAAKK